VRSQIIVRYLRNTVSWYCVAPGVLPRPSVRVTGLWPGDCCDRPGVWLDRCVLGLSTLTPWSGVRRDASRRWVGWLQSTWRARLGGGRSSPSSELLSLSSRATRPCLTSGRSTGRKGDLSPFLCALSAGTAVAATGAAVSGTLPTLDCIVGGLTPRRAASNCMRSHCSNSWDLIPS
jgi:hypothetical protein